MKRPSFQFYPADWLSDMQLRLLPWACKGLYMDLLCYCWREGWIPADGSAIAQLCGCHDLAIVEPCLKLFQPHPEDPTKLIHKRLQEEKNKQDEHKKERSESGKRGAKARWNKGKIQSDGSANSSANGSAINQPMAKNGSSSSTSSSNNTPLPPEGDGDPFLDSLWSAFPPSSRNRSSKAKLKKSWDSARPKPSKDHVLASARRWAASYDWTKEGGRYAPAADRWVRERKWESDPEPELPINGNHPKRELTSADVGI